MTLTVSRPVTWREQWGLVRLEEGLSCMLPGRKEWAGGRLRHGGSLPLPPPSLLSFSAKKQAWHGGSPFLLLSSPLPFTYSPIIPLPSLPLLFSPSLLFFSRTLRSDLKLVYSSFLSLSGGEDICLLPATTGLWTGLWNSCFRTPAWATYHACDICVAVRQPAHLVPACYTQAVPTPLYLTTLLCPYHHTYLLNLCLLKLLCDRLHKTPPNYLLACPTSSSSRPPPPQEACFPNLPPTNMAHCFEDRREAACLPIAPFCF